MDSHQVEELITRVIIQVWMGRASFARAVRRMPRRSASSQRVDYSCDYSSLDGPRLLREGGAAYAEKERIGEALELVLNRRLIIRVIESFISLFMALISN